MLRKSMIALAALTSVGTAALSPTSASAFGGNHGGGYHDGFGGFGGYHDGFSGYGGYHGGWNHWGYWNSYCCWSYGYPPSVYSAPSYSSYSTPSYSTPTPPIAVTQKVYVEGNNNSGPPPAAPEGPPPPR
jgi:hypothetical protein